jgi:hypothetical protein
MYLVVAAVVAVVVVVVAFVMRARLRPDVPTQPRRFEVPAQLDRSDFARPSAPWLVAVFSSSSCLACADTWSKVSMLGSTAVAVDDVEVSARRALHRRYRIDAVPTVVVADSAGVVRASFLGPPSAADLWATVAELRSPGSVSGSVSGSAGSCDRHASAPSGSAARDSRQ